MTETEYILYYNENARKRHFHKTEKGNVIKFVVQLEVKVRGNWRVVIRYDCAHNYSHCDRYNWKEDHFKEDLNLPYKDSLTLADEDIDDNWEVYISEFLKGVGS